MTGSEDNWWTLEMTGWHAPSCKKRVPFKKTICPRCGRRWNTKTKLLRAMYNDCCEALVLPDGTRVRIKRK